ncbi:hypothetical protein Tdes44962_MAKER09466 [Teratosphaeria destructans]|uniref:RNA ligase/cyclic nucleotide phosphodiesterase n=1 Tax=Teratosphaeria destructans TaxID=418781 RepID=A0A9W7ST46_9PEZI|nr:hypothetical protein Tdes44962_MAKER09466 [Teratosphaeria destructans]
MAAYYTFEDLSGSNDDPAHANNPYQGLIDASGNDATRIQERYEAHRTKRNSQQRHKLLASDFPGVIADEILAKLEDPAIGPDFRDWRHCLVFWARPTAAVRSLIAVIQDKLRDAAPGLWIMPPASLHMTALEITHSRRSAEIDVLVGKMLPAAQAMADYTLDHRARLVRPLVSYDAQALALSWLPAAGEHGHSAASDAYTYHHLRRDLHDLAHATGVEVASRYVIPSAHLTIARFITTKDFETAHGTVDHHKVAMLVKAIDEINDWLMEEYWPSGAGIKEGGEWTVGEETGLDFRKGTLWYGGGNSVRLGSGI